VLQAITKYVPAPMSRPMKYWRLTVGVGGIKRPEAGQGDRLPNGAEVVRFREVLRCARTLARAMGTLESK
jgi:hypothetical protein